MQSRYLHLSRIYKNDVQEDEDIIENFNPLFDDED